MKIKYTTEEVPEFTLIPAGQHPFEVVGYDSSIAKGDKTNGCDQVVLKLRFFRDKEFKQPLGQFSERITLPGDDEQSGLWMRDRDLADFLNQIASMFAKCVGFDLNEGEEVEFNETLIGRRGLAYVAQTPKRSNPTEKYNHVKTWITNGEKFEPACPSPARPF